MKRFLIGVLVVFLSVISQAQSVKADLIIEPDNRFYEKHKDECTYITRWYKANGDISTWEAPNSAAKSGTIKDGERIHVLFIYTDRNGVDWGVQSGESEEWILMADTILIYDSKQFMEDYADKITEESVEVIPEGTELIFWTYPQSGEIRTEINALDNELEITTFFTDNEGRKWGYCGYYRGNRDVWVCLSDLNNPDISAKKSPSEIPGQEIAKEKIDAVKENTQSPVRMVTLIMAVVLIAVTAGLLIWLFWIKKRRE